MSVKPTSKGLLAAAAALCVVLLQLPASTGSTVHAAGVATHRAASRVALRPRTQTIGPSTPVSFTTSIALGNGPSTLSLPGSSAAISPTAAPVGSPITVTGVISNVAAPTSPLTVTLNVTDTNGTRVVTTTTTTVASTGRYTLTATLPVTTAYGVPAITVSTNNAGGFSANERDVATITGFTVNQPSLSFSPNLGAFLRCITATIALTNFAPGVGITPTIVYSSTSGVTTTLPLSLTTGSAAVVSPTVPISDGSASEGNITGTVTLPANLVYGTTAVISVGASYPFTPTTAFTATPSTVGTPSVSVAAVTSANPVQVITGGPLGPNPVAGSASTIGVTGRSFIPNTPVTLTFGLSGTTPAALPSAAVATDASGIFTTTATFTPTLAGTYVLTGTDVTGCNVISTSFTVISPAVPGAPVSTVYFAEGYTGSGASNGKSSYVETLDLLNPNVATVVVTDTYLLETTNEDITTTTASPDVVVVTHTLSALADVSVNVASDIASTAVSSGPDAGKLVSGFNQKVATRVQTAGLQNVGALAGLGGLVRGVAAERIIERVNNSGARTDGDVSLGATSASTSYYFAEGYTGSGFQEYLVLLNPSSTLPATVTVNAVPEGTASASAPLVSALVLAPLQRLTLNINRLNAGLITSPTSSGNKIGLIVNSDTNPIVAERVNYFGPGNGSAKPGETIAAGTTTAAKQLNFSYASLTAASPDVVATITPTSDLAQTVDDRPFITVINPNIAGQVVAGTLSGSVTAPGPAAHVTVQLRGENGRLLGFFFTDVDAGARFTLSYNDLTSSSSGIGFPGIPQSAPARAGVFSTVVSSSERVVAELAQYYGQGSVTPSGDAGSGAPGLALVGAPTGETNVLFPALSTTDPASSLPLSQTVFLYNPGVDPIRVNGTFFGPAGVLAHYAYQIQPDGIQVIGQTSSSSSGVANATAMPIPAGTTGAEFSTIQQRGSTQSGEPGQAPEAFVASAVTHSADGSNWWGTQGYYPLPVNAACATSTGQPLGAGCP